MDKVICDICGTSYPETAECCPICGCTRDISAELMAEEEDFLKDSPLAAAKKVDGKYITNPEYRKDEDLDEEEDWEEDDYEDEDGDDEAPGRGKTGVVILLVVLIMILLAVTGFLFLRYLLPNLGGEEPAVTEPSVTETEMPVQTTTEPGIPCEQLIMMSGAAIDLTREGEYRLINVIVKPEDTTDKLIYTSADESVATVNAEGRVTAISEGETVIIVSCGNQQVECRVFVRYVEETEPPTEESTVPTVEESVDETEPDVKESEEETVPEETTEPDETEAAVETQGQLKDVTLKLGRTDISMGVGLQFTIPLDCDLSYEEIEWTTGNSNIATVKDGVITTHAQGTTQLTARYGDQVVTCWIRVKF